MATPTSIPKSPCSEVIENEFINQINTIRTKIPSLFRSLIAGIKKRETQLLQDLDSIEETYRDEFRQYKKNISELENLKERALSALSTKIVDVTQIYDNLRKQFEDEINNVKNRVENRCLAFKWDNDLAEDILEIGRLIASTSTTDMHAAYKAKSSPIISTGDIECAWGVAVDDTTSNIYIVDHSQHRVCIFKPNGEFIRHFSGDSNNEIAMCYPLGIAIYEDKVFVSQNRSHCIHIYDKNGIFIERFGSYGCGISQLSNPSGIHVSPLNGDLYVCEYYNHRLQIFNKYCEHKSFFGVNKWYHPRDIKLTPKEIFILGMDFDTCVHVYNYDQVLLRCIINKIGDEFSVIIKDARCMCIDKDSNVILSDNGLNRVTIFNSSGELVHQIGLVGCNVEIFVHPKGIAIDLNGRLIVCNGMKNSCLQIF